MKLIPWVMFLFFLTLTAGAKDVVFFKTEKALDHKVIMFMPGNRIFAHFYLRWCESVHPNGDPTKTKLIVKTEDICDMTVYRSELKNKKLLLIKLKKAK